MNEGGGSIMVVGLSLSSQKAVVLHLKDKTDQQEFATSFVFVQFFHVLKGQLCHLEICLSSMDKCHRQSQIFPVSLADFAISEVLI